jgi:undecaprenyl-diphosphatase
MIEGSLNRLDSGQRSSSHVLAACLLCCVGFGLVAALVSAGALETFDERTASFVQSWESPGITAAMKAITSLGYGWVTVLVCVAFLLFQFFVLRQRRELLVYVAAVAGAGLLNELLKAVFRRARPTVHRIAEAHGFSFPSGHSMISFALFGMSAYFVWKHVPTGAGRSAVLAAAALLVLLVGLSRIYLGVHYPSDVIGGYLASGAWLAAAIRADQRLRRARDGDA